MVDTVATNALQSAVSAADADEVIMNQGGVTKRGALTIIADYVASKLWGAWATWVPTVTATTPAGSGFVSTVHTAKYKKVGRTVHVMVDVSVSNLGTGPAASGSLTVTLPTVATNRHNGGGKEIGISSKGLVTNVSAGSNIMDVSLADASSSSLSVVGRRYCLFLTYESNT